MILLLFLLGILLINPLFAATFSMLGMPAANDKTTTIHSPPPPQEPEQWINVFLDTEYNFDDNSVTVSWSGKPSLGTFSPFNPLYNWTKSGSIDGGIWDGNPGNTTIIAVAWDNTTTAAEVADFLNFTMENYIRYASWPTLSIFNFTEYENQTTWVFDDAIASHLEFLNNTFFLVANATSYLINGFNATGISTALTEYHIHMEWYETSPHAEISISYTIPNVIEQRGDTSILRLGQALGRTTPLNLTGPGTVFMNGPYNRVILNGTPADVFESVVFPYYPVGVEEYWISADVTEFDYAIWFRESNSVLAVTREFSTIALNRGDILGVKITVVNTGDTPFNQVVVSDVESIETGMFQLVSGVASATASNLAPGANLTFEYTAIALVSGVYEYPAVGVAGTNLFFDQFTFSSPPQTLTIGSGLTPSEVTLIGVGVVIIIIIVIALLLYRFRRRLF